VVSIKKAVEAGTQFLRLGEGRSNRLKPPIQIRQPKTSNNQRNLKNGKGIIAANLAQCDKKALSVFLQDKNNP
jgi:hypothetical protein